MYALEQRIGRRWVRCAVCGNRTLLDRVDMAKSLFGILPPDVTVEQAREERLDQI